MGEHDDADIWPDGVGDRITRHRAQFAGVPQQRDQALGDVEVGREVSGLRQDHTAVRTEAERRAEQLEHVDRRGVGGNHGARRRTEQAANLVADALGQADPSGVVPRPDQPPAPFLLDDCSHAGRGRPRQRAQRIAVEVDHPVGKGELGAERGEHVRLVQRDKVGAGDHSGAPNCFRTATGAGGAGHRTSR